MDFGIGRICVSFNGKNFLFNHFRMAEFFSRVSSGHGLFEIDPFGPEIRNKY
jgi:hypothetical protein